MIHLSFGGEGEGVVVKLSLPEAEALVAHLTREIAKHKPDRTNPAHAALAVERSFDVV